MALEEKGQPGIIFMDDCWRLQKKSKKPLFMWVERTGRQRLQDLCNDLPTDRSQPGAILNSHSSLICRGLNPTEPDF